MKKSKLAIWSFILSLIPMIWPVWYILRQTGNILNNFIGSLVLTSTVTFWIGFFAIILGIIALFKIRKNNLEGKWFAIVGIIIGSIPTIIALIFIILNILNL